MRTRVVAADQGMFMVERRVCASFPGQLFDVGVWAWVAPVIVVNLTEMKSAGLYYPTLFDLERCKWIGWTHKWFISPDPCLFSTPEIGKLTGSRPERLVSVFGRREAKGMGVPVQRSRPKS